MKPNIVIVMTDQHRADLRKGCGYPLDTMPFLDSFAKNGYDMRRAYTPNPCCKPARVSMFTGRYPSCHNVRTNHNINDVVYKEDMLSVFKRAGYRTALCGKNDSHVRWQRFDFCERNGHLGKKDTTGASEEQKALWDYLDATRHMEMHSPSPGGVELQHPYRNVSSAFKFLDENKDGKPFFMWLSFAEPHNPYQVPQPYFDMFPPEALPPISSGADKCKVKGKTWEWERKCWETVLGENTEERINRARSNYHGMLRLIDDQFKRFIEGLEERGLRENTVIVFLSDHGDFAGEYGLIRKGVSLPEVLCHITMAWQGPGMLKGVTDTEHCVNLVDILPTVCELTGESIPFGCQGRSLVDLLKGNKVPAGEFDVAYSEFGYGGLYWNEEDHLTTAADRCLTDGKTFACISSWTASGQMRMARKGNYKIIMDMMGNGELYDLSSDPFEVNDLWNDPEYASVKSDMLVTLCAAVLKAADPLPAPRNRYRAKAHPKGYWNDESYVAEDPGVPDEIIDQYVHPDLAEK